MFAEGRIVCAEGGAHRFFAFYGFFHERVDVKFVKEQVVTINNCLLAYRLQGLAFFYFQFMCHIRREQIALMQPKRRILNSQFPRRFTKRHDLVLRVQDNLQHNVRL